MFQLLILCGSMANATLPLKLLQAESLQKILAERDKQTFILLLWSIDCPPCLQELSNLEQFREQLSSLNTVLVSTDKVQHTDLVQATLSQYKLEHLDNWIFANTMPEKLRYSIDSNWYGELPRAYFYNNNQRISHSGIVSKTTLKQWIQQLSKFNSPVRTK